MSSAAREAPCKADEMDRCRRSSALIPQTTLQRFQIAGDHGQQIVEVVRDPAGELADRLHLLDLAELFLRFPPLREIARYLGKADQLSVRIADRVDDHARPEPAAVLSDTPALAFVFPGRDGLADELTGESVPPVLLGVEAGEVLAEDFRAGIALEAFRARVPVDDIPLGIEHVDRIVGHAFDQQAEPPFALAQPGIAGLQLLRSFADARFQRLAERQQANLEHLPLGDVETGPAQPANGAGAVARGLPFYDQPVDAAIRMGDAKLGAEDAIVPGVRDRRSQLEPIIGEDGALPLRQRRFHQVRSEAEEHGNMRRGDPGIGRQIEVERTDPSGLLGETQPFLGQAQGCLHMPAIARRRGHCRSALPRRIALASRMARSFPSAMCRGR